MDWAGFEQRFRLDARGWPLINMGFGWDFLRPTAPSIRTESIASVEGAKALLCSWYAPRDNGQIDYRVPQARHLTIGDVAGNLGLVGIEDAGKIASIAAASPQPLEVPAYVIGERFMLLDGNHRTVAAVLAGMPEVITVYAVEGPVDRRALIDLWRYDGKGPVV